MIGLYKIFDAHFHFYSNSYFKLLIKQKLNRLDIGTELKNIAAKGYIEIPGEDSLQLAKRWIEQIDKWKIERTVLFSSIPGDEDSVVKAINAYPTRFTGFFTIDPNSNLLMENATKRIKEDKLKGIILYPSLYHINVNDEWLNPLYELIQEVKGIIYVHFGKLIMKTRDYANIPLVTNNEFSNPKDLIPVAQKFKNIKFIIPNFGAGKLAETLEVGKSCPNVYVDTSGSNSWTAEYAEEIDLRKVFQKFLQVFTANRILFGSDTGLFPRGYRYDILDNQLKLLQEMRLSINDMKKIFYENMANLVDNIHT